MLSIALLLIAHLGSDDLLFIFFLPLVAVLLLLWLLRRSEVKGTASPLNPDELRKLHRMYEQGMISEVEYEEQKRRLLNQ